MAELPVIRFAGAADADIASQLDAAFRNTGFCYFTEIDVAPALVSAAFQASRDFHALPRSAKDAIEIGRAHV